MEPLFNFISNAVTASPALSIGISAFVLCACCSITVMKIRSGRGERGNEENPEVQDISSGLANDADRVTHEEAVSSEEISQESSQPSSTQEDNKVNSDSVSNSWTSTIESSSISAKTRL
jgi:hypothetical protein